MIRDLMTAQEYDRIEKMEGSTKVAWTYFSRWRARWRETHIDDERGDMELIAEFERQVMKLRGIKAK